jgi:hypothetical protein
MPKCKSLSPPPSNYRVPIFNLWNNIHSSSISIPGLFWPIEDQHTVPQMFHGIEMNAYGDDITSFDDGLRDTVGGKSAR